MLAEPENAPKEKVWDTMLGDAGYRAWTKPFNQGSYYEGSLEEGSEIRFLGCDEDGKLSGGMLSRVKENRRPDFISFEHIGMIDGEGNVDTESDLVKSWTPAYENYTFNEIDGGTEVLVDMQMGDDDMGMSEAWPKALELLKESAEK